MKPDPTKLDSLSIGMWWCGPMQYDYAAGDEDDWVIAQKTATGLTGMLAAYMNKDDAIYICDLHNLHIAYRASQVEAA